MAVRRSKGAAELNRNPSNSNKIRTADSSTCSAVLSTPPSSSGKISPAAPRLACSNEKFRRSRTLLARPIHCPKFRRAPPTDSPRHPCSFAQHTPSPFALQVESRLLQPHPWGSLPLAPKARLRKLKKVFPSTATFALESFCIWRTGVHGRGTRSWPSPRR